MKKKMIMILLTIAAMTCGVTGCGEIPEPSTTGTEAIETTEAIEETKTEETKTEEELAADLEQLEAAIAAEAEPVAEADLVAEADDGDVIIEITDQSAEEDVDLENFIKAKYSYLKMKGADVVDQVTGGLLEIADELAAYVKTIK